MGLVEVIYFLIFPILFGFSMYGWGSILSNKLSINYVSIKIVVGMALILFLGGVLNVLKISFKQTIDIIFLLGLIFSIIKIYKSIHNKEFFNIFRNINKKYFIFFLPTILLIIHIIFSLNPGSYNVYDDLQKYFVHPIKMLETGSVFGSTLSSMGSQTLGGQAFFQSFFISWLGINSFNIFDNIFCLIITCLLLLEYSIKSKNVLFGSLILCLVILIHSQFVNISSIYSGVIFIISTIIISLEFINKKINLEKTIIILSLFFASLFVIKTTLGLFSVVFFSLFLFSTFFVKKFNNNFFKLSVLTPSLSILLSFPWSFFSIKQFLIVKDKINEPLNIIINENNIDFLNFFSSETLFYGVTQLHYTMLSIIAFVVIFLTYIIDKKQNILSEGNSNGVLLVASNSVLSGFFIYLGLVIFGQLHHSLSTVIRYSIPFLIATIPLGILMMYSILPKTHRIYKLIFFILIISISVSFIPQYVNKIIQSYKCKSQLSFSKSACSKKFINYNENIFDSKKKILTQNLQKEIPAGKSIMVWINTPFFLNFKRNEIIEIDLAGFGNPWAIFPSAEYMIWEHSGYATHSIEYLNKMTQTEKLYDAKNAFYALNYMKNVDEMFKRNEISIIKKDNQFIIFRFKN